MTLNTVTYTVVENNKTAGQTKMAFYENNRSWDGVVELSEAGIPTRFYVEQLVEQQLSTKEQALGEYSQTDYYRSQIINIDNPLGNLDNLKSIILSLPLMAKHGIVNDQRQYVDNNGYLHINQSSLEKNIDEDGQQHIQTIDKHLPLSQQETDSLQKLAMTVVGNSQDTRVKVKKLLNFVSTYLVDAPVISPMSVTKILEQRKGDCTEHTRLFNALARSLSIPAREVEGLVYLGEGKNSLFNKMHKNSNLSFKLIKANYLK